MYGWHRCDAILCIQHTFDHRIARPSVPLLSKCIPICAGAAFGAVKFAPQRFKIRQPRFTRRQHDERPRPAEAGAMLALKAAERAKF